MRPVREKEEPIPELAAIETGLEDGDLPVCDYEEGDKVVYPHHGAGVVLKKETKELMGVAREYLTIQILHNDLTVMVPCENAARAGLRRVIDEDEIKKVIAVLTDEVSEMPKNWNRRFKYNREKIKTGDVFELAEVVRNLAIREWEKGLSTGEKQMYTRAKKILASEFMYALDKDEDGAEVYLDELLEERFAARPSSSWRADRWSSGRWRRFAAAPLCGRSWSRCRRARRPASATGTWRWWRADGIARNRSATPSSGSSPSSRWSMTPPGRWSPRS
jgi:CarD family transcriptional regulator